MFAKPRVRCEWQQDAPDALAGRVTMEEGLWVVVITMGVAGMRDTFITEPDLEWWLLHTLVFVGLVFSCTSYCCNFNDTDAFHQVLWALWLLGLIGQIACLDKSLAGFAGATAFLYALLAVARMRVAVLLPRARALSLFFGASALLSCALFAALALLPAIGAHERLLLLLSYFIEPAFTLAFVACAASSPARARAWDVPFDVDYLQSRLEGFHMMIIVCSFLFPLGLQGALVEASPLAAAALLLANGYAVLLKLSVLDVDPGTAGGAMERHALRRMAQRGGPHPATLGFILSSPFSVVGIALSGVGFVSGVVGKGAVQLPLCSGAALTCATLALQKALHAPAMRALHWLKAGVLLVGAATFLLPLPLRLGPLDTLAWAAGVMGLVLLLQLLLESLMGGAFERWRWRAPHLLADWCDEAERERLMGPHVTSHEHFFTVLVAVTVFQLNEQLREHADVPWYALCFGAVYGILANSMRYAARFNDDDAAHKLLWSAFQFGFLFMLEGLGTSSAVSGLSATFALSAAGMHTLLALGFTARLAAALPAARRFVLTFGGANLACAAAYAAVYWDAAAASTPALCFSAIVNLVLLDAALLLSGFGGRVPLNADYIVSRFGGLFMEVLGVAVVVPNAFFPPAFAHAGLVLVAVLMVAVLTVALKIGYFDVEPVDAAHHAVHGSALRAYLFATLFPLATLGLAATGGGAAILIPAAGAGGLSARTPFGQLVLCGATALTWVSLAATNALHHGASRAALAAKITGCAVLLAPLLVELGDAAVLALVVGVNVGIVAALKLFRLGNARKEVARPSARRPPRRESYVGGGDHAVPWSLQQPVVASSALM